MAERKVATSSHKTWVPVLTLAPAGQGLMPSPLRQGNCAIGSSGQCNSEPPVAGVHPTKGSESSASYLFTWYFCVCQSPVALGPLAPLQALRGNSSIARSLVGPGSHSFLCSHTFCFSHAQFSWVSLRAKICLCAEGPAHFLLRNSVRHLWAEVALSSPCSQRVKTHRPE